MHCRNSEPCMSQTGQNLSLRWCPRHDRSSTESGSPPALATRKSTEYNLELAFNSLDAQREACEGYIYCTRLTCAYRWHSYPTRPAEAPSDLRSASSGPRRLSARLDLRDCAPVHPIGLDFLKERHCHGFTSHQ